VGSRTRRLTGQYAGSLVESSSYCNTIPPSAKACLILSALGNPPRAARRTISSSCGFRFPAFAPASED
jgi:hypothetical protein